MCQKKAHGSRVESRLLSPGEICLQIEAVHSASFSSTHITTLVSTTSIACLPRLGLAQGNGLVNHTPRAKPSGLSAR